MTRQLICIPLFVLIVLTGFQNEGSSIDSLLINPFDLQKFKKVKGPSNSGGANKKSYYFKPDTVGMYYQFAIWSSNKGYLGSNKSDTIDFPELLRITTYKPLGKYKNRYLDPTEILIEVVALYNDYKLPELAFVGLDTVKIKDKLGVNFLRKDSCFIYTKDKTALTLKIKGKNVKWLKWTRLNTKVETDNIPDGLTVSAMEG